MSKTSVLFLIFTRLDTTQLVLEQIRKAKPAQLFVAADGPRPDKVGEKEKCEQVRQMVMEGIDWDCDVQTLFRDKNLGCGVAPATAIDWFFEHVEQGIILEDDCVPDPSFFAFCEQMLDYYKDSEQVMHIAGTNLIPHRKYGKASYYFSRYNPIWGWATWRRAWKFFDYNISDLDDFKQNKKIEQVISEPIQQKYWLDIFELVRDGKRTDIWDYQWTYAIFNKKKWCIIPNNNMISNIGIGENSTHTYQTDMKTGRLPTATIDTITHPSHIVHYPDAESRMFKDHYQQPTSLINKIRNLVYKFISPETIRFVKKTIKNPMYMIKKLLEIYRYRKTKNSLDKDDIKRILQTLIPANAVILEAGSHNGFDTAQMAMLFPRAHIYGFEPIPDLFKNATANTRKFSNVRLFPLALGESIGEGVIHVSEGGVGGSSSLLEPKEHLNLFPDVKFEKKIKIQTTTLDDWALENNISKIDFMWLDMQGYEMTALKAGKHILATVKAIYMEVASKEIYHGAPLVDEIVDWMKNQGFYVHKKYMQDDEIYGEMLFVRSR